MTTPARSASLLAELARRLKAVPADRRAAELGRLDRAIAPTARTQRAGDDDSVDDAAWFTSRPTARERLRAPFPGEFSRAILKKLRKQLQPGQVLVVHVRVTRDANGRPAHRVRGVLAIDGGRA